jgi:glycosyltransferase involved in cell wall biosynthesis
MQPVTIIATVLNEVQDITRLVPSLLAQDPPPSEIIIVDGGSTDGTWEWLVEAGKNHRIFKPIRDESCNLKNCRGPVSRGRNVAIAAASSEIIACADAGCTYAPDWLSRLTAPILSQSAIYALGGACLDLSDPTIWDIASAPFLGVKYSPTEPTKSCTARSMAFTKELWKRIGGFPESVLLGDDTLFDLEARRLTAPAFVDNAKAIYRPQNTLESARRQLARYATSDGVLDVRRVRLVRNATRCLLQVLAVLTLPWASFPFFLVFLMQCWLAYHSDWSFIRTMGWRTIRARFGFSVMVPWIITANHLEGLITKKEPGNSQNAQP